MKQKKITLALLVALICCGFALRLYRINVVPLRGDEAFTVLNWMRQPFAETLEHVATRDPQPPLAYATYRLYALVVGDQEHQVRFLPALLNVLGIPGLYALGKRMGGRRLGLLAALLWAVNPYQIWHAQDARNYAIWAALSPVALWLALCALERRRLVDWALYVFFACIALYFYYLELFVLLAVNLYVLIVYRRDRGLLARWFVCQFVIALVLAPWYLQERLLLGSGYGGTAVGFDPLRLLTYFIPSLLYGEKYADQLMGSDGLLFWGMIVVLVGLLVAGWVGLWRQCREKAVLAGLVGTIPLVLLGVVSLKLNVFTPRYVLAVSPVYVVLYAVVLLKLWSDRERTTLSRVGFVLVSFVVLFLNISSLLNYYFLHDYAKARDWRSLAAYLATWSHTDDLTLNTSADEAFTFYHGEYDIVAEQIRLPASGEQPVEEIETILSDAQTRYESIWLAAQTPSDWRTAGIVEAWLAQNMQSVRQTSIDGLRVQEFMGWDIEPITQPARAEFGEIVELAGDQVFLPPEPTGEITVWLYWRPLSTSPTPLKVFVHLLGEINPETGTPLWSQDDQYPQDGRINTTSWETDALYRDVFTLPLYSVPAGQYTLAVGFYDPDTNERLPVDNSDHFILQTIIISDYAK